MSPPGSFRCDDCSGSTARALALALTSRALVSEAWLGPGYQITAQTNIVKPGGKAQQPHRDYRTSRLGLASP